MPTSAPLNKADAYRRLVAARKACRRCPGLTNPSTIADGRLDSEAIGPWSLWQGNLNATVVIVGQDWGDVRYFVKNNGRDHPTNPTNKTLATMLESAGILIGPAEQPNLDASVFLTNAILCLKDGADGGMQQPVKDDWFSACGSAFLNPLIDIVSPRAIVTLGERAYRAVAGCYRLRTMAFRNAVEHAGGFIVRPDTRLFPMYHCGARTLNTYRPRDEQARDWERVRRAVTHFR